MSFLKKLTKEFEELKATFTDEPKKDEPKKEQAQAQTSPPHEQQRACNQNPVYNGAHQPYGQPQYQHQQPYAQQPYAQPAHGQQPHDGQYQPPPPRGQHPGSPPLLPQGWIMQFDPNSQRNYFVETATGRTQWEPPTVQHPQYPPPPDGLLGPDASRGAAGGYYAQHQYNQQGAYAGAPGYNPHGAPGPYDPSAASHIGTYPPGAGHETGGKEKKDHSTRNMLLAGGAGLADGALLYNALNDSDDEKHTAPAAAPAGYYSGAPPPAAGGYYGGDPSYGQQGVSPATEAPLPTHDADGDYVDASDRESVEEAREDVLEAQQELAEASSESDRESAREDLEEAQEEYAEEYEETYDD